MKIRFLFPCALLAMVSLSGAPLDRYQIEGHIDVHRNMISGTETIVLKNSTPTPLSEVYLFLYPNRFQRKNPDLNEMNYLWHYPSGFDQGWMKIGSIQGSQSQETLSGEVVDQAGLPDKTVFRISLSPPLAPGAEKSIRIEFESNVPHKYGPYGHYRDTLTAQGGWYPYLVPLSEAGHPLFHALPRKSSFQVRLKLNSKRDAVVNGKFFDDVTEISLPAREAQFVSLVMTPQFHVHTRHEGSKTVTFYSLKQKRYKLKNLMITLGQVVRQATSFFSVETSDKVTVVETYLRSVMTFPGENMVLISDRMFYTPTMFDLRNLSRLEIAAALARALVSDRVVKREDVTDYNWVAELLGRAFRNEYLTTNFKTLSNLRETAGRMGMFRPFNRMAASPTIPFSETYIGDVINRDPMRESLLYFNNRLPSGQLFAEKLLRTIGKESYGKIIHGYLQQNEDFQSSASNSSGQDMSWFFDQWKKGYPSKLDYALSQVDRNKKTDAGYVTRFTVTKSSGSQFVDPVEARVSTQGGDNPLVLWDGRGTEHTFEVRTSTKVSTIEIDPRHQTLQTNLRNDIAPHNWEMVMDRGDVDIGSGGIGAGMRIRMHKVRDRGKWMFVLPFFSPAELGVEAGMLFNFGGTVGGLVWNRKQEMSLSYTFTKLRSGFADLESHRMDGSGMATGLKFRYTYENKMFEEDPMSFEKFELTSAVYRNEFGGNFDFFQVGMTAAKAIALHPKHKLAGIVSLNYSDGFRSEDHIPAQKLVDLASKPSIGFAGSGRFLAENDFTTSLEWRHDLMADIDMNMPMNNRIRRIQGVLSFDVGWISPRFDELFRLNEAIYGIGYGLRFFYDFLGVRPSNFSVDFGYRLGDGARDGGSRFVFVLGILQRF